MKISLLFCVALLVLTGCSETKESLSQQIVDQYKASYPDLGDAEITLNACVLNIRTQISKELKAGMFGQSEPTQVLQYISSKTNLRSYDFRRAPGGKRGNIYFATIAKRKLNSRMINEAKLLIDHAIDYEKESDDKLSLNSFSGDENSITNLSSSNMKKLDKSKVGRILRTGTLKFSLKSLVKTNEEDAPLKPNKDSAFFFDHVKRVENDKDITDFSSNMLFLGRKQHRMQLFSGLLYIPRTFDIISTSKSGLEDLIKYLSVYQRKFC